MQSLCSTLDTKGNPLITQVLDDYIKVKDREIMYEFFVCAFTA